MCSLLLLLRLVVVLVIIIILLLCWYCFLLFLRQIASGGEISRLIKMLTSDNVKDMARKLGKSSHAHPLIFAEKVLNQLER